MDLYILVLQTLADYHSCRPVGHLVIAIADKLLLDVRPLAVADLQLVSYHSQNEACLVVAPHLLKLCSLHHQPTQHWQTCMLIAVHYCSLTVHSVCLTKPQSQQQGRLIQLQIKFQPFPEVCCDAHT